MTKHYGPLDSAKALARIGCVRAGLPGDPEGAWCRANQDQQKMLVAHLGESLEADRQAAPSGWVEAAEAEYWRFLGKTN